MSFVWHTILINSTNVKKNTFCRCIGMGDLSMQVSARSSVSIYPGCLVSETPLTVLKLCWCFLHGVRMCMWFGYNC